MIKGERAISGDVLIAEDDSVNAAYLSRILENKGIRVKVCPNGRQALRAWQEHPCDVIVSDLAMPEMTGQELLSSLHGLKDPPVFIVETENNDQSTIIELMKLGASDYILKPVQPEDFFFKVIRAVELAHLRRNSSVVLHEREERLDRDIEWNSMKERVIARGYDRYDRNLFACMRNSFSQGSGIGSMVTIASLIEKSLKLCGDNYMCRRDLMDMLLNHAGVARKALEMISSIYDLIENKPRLEKISLMDFYQQILMLLDKNRDKINLHSHNILINEIHEDHQGIFLMVNMKYILTAVEELVLNALKFSVPGSEIYLFCNCTPENMFLSVINRPDTMMLQMDQWDETASRLIFEPFFRLANFVSEEYGTLDIGLGLTFVEKIMRSHRGKICVSKIRDESHLHGQDSNERINFEMRLPVFRDRLAFVPGRQRELQRA